MFPDTDVVDATDAEIPEASDTVCPDIFTACTDVSDIIVCHDIATAVPGVRAIVSPDTFASTVWPAVRDTVSPENLIITVYPPLI
jgi:hypothetical protein